MAYNKNIRKLSLTMFTPGQHTQTCNYWYAVQTDHMAHVAFETFEGLSKWMAERGINFSKELPEKGTHHWQPLIGEYSENSHMSYDEFYALEGYQTKVMSNADWTLGIITADENGYRTVHTLNPNCKYRPVYDYQQTQKEMR